MVSPDATQIDIAGSSEVISGQVGTYTVMVAPPAATVNVGTISYQWRAPVGWIVDTPNASTTNIKPDIHDREGDVLVDVPYCNILITSLPRHVTVRNTQPPCPHESPCNNEPPVVVRQAPRLVVPVLRVYPNPASGYLFVESTPGPQAGEVELLNWQGQAIVRHPLDDTGRVRLPLAELPPGLYLGRFLLPNGTKFSSQKVQIN